MANKLLFYIGDTLIGDINRYAKSRHLVETLKSESSSPTADTFTFTINWAQFKEFIAIYTDESAASFLKVGKTRIVFETNGFVRFAGWLAAKPARSGIGSAQELQLTFYEYFARLSGDLVCSNTNKLDPYVRFDNVPAHQVCKDLIDLFIAHALDAGEVLNWTYGTVDTLAPISRTYEDFQTISKALCDRMNNVTGAGQFDIVFRLDPSDYTHVIIDILKPRGVKKNIIIEYPGNGIYKLWATEFSVQETNDYASEVLIAGNGQVGSVSSGEQTAKLGTADDAGFVADYCYYRRYTTRSDLESQDAVDSAAQTELVNRGFVQETPDIRCTGINIEWGNASNMNNGLGLGDTFYFKETTDDMEDNSGWYRIILLDSTWDDNGVETAAPKLKRAEA